MADYDALKRQARQIEVDLDVKMLNYSKLGSQWTSSRASEAAEMEIEHLIKSRMAKMVDGIGSSGNTSMVHLLQRHRDILNDHVREFRKIKCPGTRRVAWFCSRRYLVRLNFLADCRHHRANVGQMEGLLNERRRIDNVNRTTDQLIESAYGARSALTEQRNVLMNSTRRLGGALSQVPGLNSLINKISVRKRRDSIIMAIVIAFCILLITFYSMK